MSYRVYYEFTEDAQYEEITDRVRLYTLDVTQNSDEGSVALSTIRVDDPDGDYDIVGFRRLYINESTATGSNQAIYNGYVADRTVERGPFVTESGRVWVVQVADSNSVAHWRVLNGADANRSAETDVARVQWLMSTNEMSRIPNTDFLSTANPVGMDAVDYRGQMAVDVLNDCAQQSGKNYGVRTTDAGTGDVGLGLWYGASGLEVLTSILRITTDLDDVDNIFTFAASMRDTKLIRDPSRVYSGVYLNWDGGTTYEEDTETSNTFTRRDTVMSADNVKTSGKAGDRAQRYLADLGEELDIIETSFLVPAAKVNFVREWQRIQFKARHLPDYEQYVYMRILQRKVSQTESEEQYRIWLKMERVGPTVADPDDPGEGEPSFLIETLTGVIGDENGGDSTQECVLYDGCTYLAVVGVAHNHAAPASTSNYITIGFWRDPVTANGDYGIYNQNWSKNMGAVRLGNQLTGWEQVFTVNASGSTPGVTHSQHEMHIRHTGYAGTNGIGSSYACDVYYVSGPDPRFA